ncbi:MAG TPA: anthranilate synthase component I family protein, partial [Thermoplasmata archaeon]|nr:anthranilate synthase component I family protein [Thermoplasmata archaeon]
MKTSKLEFKEPFDVYRRVREAYEHTFLFESLVGPERLAEFSFIGFAPDATVRVEENRFVTEGEKRRLSDPRAVGDFIKERLRSTPSSSRFAGGLVGYVSYDFVKFLEKVELHQRHGCRMPDLEMGVYLDGIVFDHRKKSATYFTHGENRLNDLRRVLREPPETHAKFAASSSGEDLDRKGFEYAVFKAKEHIAAGDIFQVVLSRERRFETSGDILQVYERLRRLNPSPYMYFIEFGPRRVVGSSPEMLVRVEGREVSTYPIAGTRRIGKDDAETAKLGDELLNDEKERAEHAMLVDLARNDVGRVAEYGSVRVADYMKVERFSHVQHIVSKVVGSLRKDRDAFDALASLFPAGTVSG